MSILATTNLAFTMLGPWEIFGILAVALELFGATRLPPLGRGIDKDFFEFKDALDNVAHDAGRSIGGIHGKPAAEALTPDNQVAEFYDPDVFRGDKQSPWWRRSIRWFITSLRRILRK